MSKSSVFENKAFQSTPIGVGFNLVSQVNNFNSIFDTKPLDLEETVQLESLLLDSFCPETITNMEQIANDVASLKQITAEIKAIGKQGIILLGERVHRARELLKTYKDGTFTRWLERTFGTRKSGYNALAYYELYTALPHDSLRDRFKKLQQRTAYILASRTGAIEIKAEIISKYHDKPHDELIMLIKEMLPISSRDKRVAKTSPPKLLMRVRCLMEKLRDSKVRLNIADKKEIIELRDLIDSILINV